MGNWAACISKCCDSLSPLSLILSFPSIRAMKYSDAIKKIERKRAREREAKPSAFNDKIKLAVECLISFTCAPLSYMHTCTQSFQIWTKIFFHFVPLDILNKQFTRNAALKCMKKRQKKMEKIKTKRACANTCQWESKKRFQRVNKSD